MDDLDYGSDDGQDDDDRDYRRKRRHSDSDDEDRDRQGERPRGNSGYDSRGYQPNQLPPSGYRRGSYDDRRSDRGAEATLGQGMSIPVMSSTRNRQPQHYQINQPRGGNSRFQGNQMMPPHGGHAGYGRRGLMGDGPPPSLIPPMPLRGGYGGGRAGGGRPQGGSFQRVSNVEPYDPANSGMMPQPRRPGGHDGQGGQGGQQQGGQGQPRPKRAHTRFIDVQQIPLYENEPKRIYAHFGKFGTITNIRTGVNSAGMADPKSAVVEFDAMAAAEKACHNREAVMNNRFIMVKFGKEEAAAGQEELARFESMRGTFGEVFRDGSGRGAGRGDRGGFRGRGSFREGGERRQPHKRLPCRILELQNVPQELNSVPIIFEHFIKFGPVINIRQINGHEGFGAHVEYRELDAAQAACGDPDAVLGNRFVRVRFGIEDYGAAEEELEKFAALIPALPGGAKAAPKTDAAAAVDSVDDAKPAAKPASTDTAAIKEMLMLHTRQQAIVEEQLKQQKLLFAKVSAASGKDRKEIVKTLMMLSKSIEANTASAKQTLAVVAAAQNKDGRRSSGEFGGRGSRGRRGRGRAGRGGRGGRWQQQQASRTVLDNRTTSVLVPAIPAAEMGSVMEQMQGHGEIRSSRVDEEAACIVVTYSRRSDAEKAMHGFTSAVGTSLAPVWHEEDEPPQLEPQPETETQPVVEAPTAPPAAPAALKEAEAQAQAEADALLRKSAGGGTANDTADDDNLEKLAR